MSTVDVGKFQARLRDIQTGYNDDTLPQIEQDFALQAGGSANAFIGKGRTLINEAQARAYLIDPMLTALGWQVAAAASMIIEDAAEPNPAPNTGAEGDEKSAHRRFLDYHGRENNGDCGRSLVIVEAKRPSAELPKVPAEQLTKIFAGVIRAIRRQKMFAPVGAQWHDWISALIDYAERSKAKYGQPSLRAVITNGEWYVVFLSVEGTLLSEDPEADQIRVFIDLDDVAARGALFYGTLNYIDLSGCVPPQHPASLPEFIADKNDIPCVLAAEISYVRYGRRQPGLAIKVVARVLSASMAWIQFEKSYGDDFISIPQNTDQLDTALITLKDRSDDLVSELSKYGSLRLLSALDIESLESKRRGTVTPTDRIEMLFWETRDRTFLLLAGSVSYFSNDATYDGCRYHAFGACRMTGDAVEPPIYQASVDPPAFFPSGSPFHCAHKAVHMRRKDICVLSRFEQHLCCRRCALFSRCWPDGGAQLPCRGD